MQVTPVALRLDESPNSVIAAQAKLKRKKFMMPLDEIRRLKNMPPTLLTKLEFRTLQQRHTAGNKRAYDRIFDLKEVRLGFRV